MTKREYLTASILAQATTPRDGGAFGSHGRLPDPFHTDPSRAAGSQRSNPLGHSARIRLGSSTFSETM